MLSMRRHFTLHILKLATQVPTIYFFTPNSSNFFKIEKISKIINSEFSARIENIINFQSHKIIIIDDWTLKLKLIKKK